MRLREASRGVRFAILLAIVLIVWVSLMAIAYSIDPRIHTPGIFWATLISTLSSAVAFWFGLFVFSRPKKSEASLR
jgi:hypothetical protein